MFFFRLRNFTRSFLFIRNFMSFFFSFRRIFRCSFSFKRNFRYFYFSGILGFLLRKQKISPSLYIIFRISCVVVFKFLFYDIVVVTVIILWISDFLICRGIYVCSPEFMLVYLIKAKEANDVTKRRGQKEYSRQSGTNKSQIYISTILAIKHFKTLQF